eukprot:55738-Rhodomonas_salina.2
MSSSSIEQQRANSTSRILAWALQPGGVETMMMPSGSKAASSSGQSGQMLSIRLATWNSTVWTSCPVCVPLRVSAMPLMRTRAISSCILLCASLIGQQSLIRCPTVSLAFLQTTHCVSHVPPWFLETTEAVGKQKALAWRMSLTAPSGRPLSRRAAPKLALPLLPLSA